MKVLIIDDYPLFQDGLELLLRHLDPKITVLKAHRIADADLLIDETLDLLFCELLASGSTLDEGFDALKALHRRLPDTPIVVLTALHDRSCVSRALEAGARAYIPKTYKSEIVLGAIRLVLSGGVYVPSDLFDSVEPKTLPRTSLAQAPGVYKGGPTLTRRQRDVLTYLTQGFTNRDIAREIDVKEGTVKIHVAAIFKALGVANRTQAVIVANRLGVLDNE